MLVEKLEQIIENWNNQETQTENLPIWNFNYGPNEWQNLGDYNDDGNLTFDERKKYLLLIWKNRTRILNDQGATEGYTYTGDLILSLRSKMQEASFQFKYDEHIKNLEMVSDRLEKEFGRCDNYTIKSWIETTVVDMFDTNMDGIKISFSIELML